MKTARSKFAALAVFTLAGVSVLVPAAPATPADAPPAGKPTGGTLDTEDRPAPQSIYAGTGIGYVLEANGNEVPNSGEQMMRVLKKLGNFVQLPVTFSAVDLHTGLQKPRIVITHRPSMTGLLDEKGQPDPNEGFSVPTLTPASRNSLTKPNLEGRLFLAANMEKINGKLKVKTFEFISWNSRKQKFDFGFIECDKEEPQIRVVDGVKCFSCHKNRGPILGQGPWSNTIHNDIVREAVASANKVDLQKLCLPRSIGQPHRLDTGFEPGIVRQVVNAECDGMAILIPQGPSVDAAVRIGAEMARDRQVFRLMLKTADGRRGLVVLLGAIVAPGDLEKNNLAVRGALNHEFSDNYPHFAEKVLAIHKASSSTLADFNPSGSQGRLMNVTTQTASGWGGGSTLQTSLQVVWGGDSKQVAEYDTARADGDHKMPSHRLPSNPKAFVPQSTNLKTPAAAVNAVGLARLIGLTEGDRTFMANQLAVAARSVSNRKITPATLAKDVFSGPQFAELFMAGEIPDREDFKDRFVKALDEALKAHGATELKLDRKDYASGPNVAVAPGKEEVEQPVVATTACLRCHDVKGAGKAAFSPIPALAFDPFDKNGREAWAKVTTANARKQVLTRLLKRLNEDRDMPPEDSAEYDTFRVKNAAEFDALREWLEAELKKVKNG